jgi:hypothetical protein
MSMSIRTKASASSSRSHISNPAAKKEFVREISVPGTTETEALWSGTDALCPPR